MTAFDLPELRVTLVAGEAMVAKMDRPVLAIAQPERRVEDHRQPVEGGNVVGGSGVQEQTRCPACSGQQVEMRTETLTINVPAGLADGARIRVPGKGHVGRGVAAGVASLRRAPVPVSRSRRGCPAHSRRRQCERRPSRGFSGDVHVRGWRGTRAGFGIG